MDLTDSSIKLFAVSKRVPLKQGLKPIYIPDAILLVFVSKRVPLKQGLKPVHNSLLHFPFFSLKESSIKTRIETLLHRT